MGMTRREMMSSSLVAAAQDGDVANLLRRIQELEEASRYLAQFQPPVGSVLAYMGDWPAVGAERERRESRWGWLLCDGRTFEARVWPELAAVLGRNQLPNFIGRVPRGKGQGQNTGAEAGRDSIPAGSTGNAGGHSHGLPSFTGGVGRIPNELANRIGNLRYSIKDDRAGWRANEGSGAHHIEVGGGDNNEGQHAHNLEGNTSNVGDHAHSIPALDIIPSYVAANFIIKASSRRG